MHTVNTEISDSTFYMWRAVFALAHADKILRNEEIRFMSEVIESHNFSVNQIEALKDDTVNPKDPVEMFEKINDTLNQAEFFRHARKFVWIDREYAKQEQDVMLQLMQIHVDKLEVSKLIGKIDMSLEE